MKRIFKVICCGNVDDGKSTLLGRLLFETGSIKQDQLEEALASSIKTEETAQPDFAMFLDGLAMERTKKITVDKNYTHGRLGTPKTGKIRVIDMSDELAKVLREWRIACPVSENKLVFPNNEGNYQSAENMMKRRFIPALNRAGIEQIRFHDLRHTYASLLLVNGAPMKYVQHMLGHSSITMTMDLYTHLLPEVNDKCVNLLNNIVNTTIEQQEQVKRFGT